MSNTYICAHFYRYMSVIASTVYTQHKHSHAHIHLRNVKSFVLAFPKLNPTGTLHRDPTESGIYPGSGLRWRVEFARC